MLFYIHPRLLQASSKSFEVGDLVYVTKYGRAVIIEGSEEDRVLVEYISDGKQYRVKRGQLYPVYYQEGNAAL